MTFTKKKLAAAVSSGFLLSLGVAGPANAVLDLELNNDADAETSQDPLTYTTSLNVDATEGLDLLDDADNDAETAGTDQDVTGVMNVNATPANTDIRLTVTLDNEATFVGAPTATFADNDAEVASEGSILTGGAGSSSVVFFGDTGTGGFEAGDTFLVGIEGVNVVNQDDVDIQTDFQIADNFGVTDIRTINDSYITFEDSFDVAAELGEADGKSIDVTANSLFFSGEGEGTETNVGAVDVTDNGLLGANTAAIEGAEIAANIDVTVTGANGLAAFTAEAGGSIEFGEENAMAVEGTTATLEDLEFGDIEGDHDVIFNVAGDNTTQISETTVVATLAGEPQSADFNVDSLNKSVNLTSLARNGSSARLTFSLTPGGAYPMFIRITNPSAIDGPVTVQLINDDGDSSELLTLTDIGLSSDDLEAGASTGLISIDDVFAAAETGGFELGATNKLRVEVIAEFGTTGENTAVIVGAFSLSTDGNTFNMMTDASN